MLHAHLSAACSPQWQPINPLSRASSLKAFRMLAAPSVTMPATCRMDTCFSITWTLPAPRQRLTRHAPRPAPPQTAGKAKERLKNPSGATEPPAANSRQARGVGEGMSVEDGGKQ